MTDDAAHTGLSLLLADGVAEAMTAAEGTLASAQSAAEMAFAGLARVQATGAAAASVPLTVAAHETPGEAATPSEYHRPAARSAHTPAPRAAGAGQVAVAPVSVPDSSMAAPMSVAPVPSLPSVAQQMFATFAPAARPVAADDAMPLSPPALETVGSDRGVQPEGQAMMAPAAPLNSEAASPASRAFAPPGVSATQGGPTGGDVFLDGTRMGTWLADHMAHEAGRPQMSSTGFDPRLTPAWPGTLQGG